MLLQWITSLDMVVGALLMVRIHSWLNVDSLLTILMRKYFDHYSTFYESTENLINEI